MKNLVRLNPEEFAVQACKIADAIDKWFSDVDFTAIKRRNLPKPLKSLDENATIEAKQKALFDYNENVAKCARKIVLESIHAMLGKNAHETIAIMALACSVEAEDVNNHTMSEYLGEVAQMLNDKNVMDFFSSLLQSGVLQLFAPSRK